MKISVITLFPDMVRCFLDESIVKRAQEKKLVEINIINLRDFATDSYGTVDDRPYGGGAGMVLKVDCIVRAIDSVKSNNSKVILTSPRGTVYNQSVAQGYAKLDHIILIAGHYEGVDERVMSYVDDEVSLGDFVMTGGEIAVAAVVDSVVRLVPGVLKKDEAVQEESYFNIGIDTLINVIGNHEVLLRLQAAGVESVRLLEYPHYTRPEKFIDQAVPTVLLSGNHSDIKKWRLIKAFEETLKRRKDLLES